MDLISGLKVVCRHWFVVAVMIAATAVGTTIVFDRARPMYQADGQIVVIPSAHPEDSNYPATVKTVNPFSQFNNSQIVAANTIVGFVGSDGFAQQMAQQGASTGYSATVTPQGFILALRASDRDPAQALHTFNLLLSTIQTAFSAEQARAGAPSDTWLRATPLSTPSSARERLTSKIKLAAGVAVLGVFATVATAFLAETMAMARRNRRLRRPILQQAGYEPATKEPATPEAPAHVRIEATVDAPGEQQADGARRLAHVDPRRRQVLDLVTGHARTTHVTLVDREDRTT